jgi:hypothetical protein
VIARELAIASAEGHAVRGSIVNTLVAVIGAWSVAGVAKWVANAGVYRASYVAPAVLTLTYAVLVEVTREVTFVTLRL